MTDQLDLNYVNQLKLDALENIESYQDPDTPDALAQYTNQMKKALLADAQMLNSLPEYLTVALYGNVRFPEQVQLKWQDWIDNNTMPTWDEFKVSVAFNNEDIALVKAVKEVSESLLKQSCAALFLLMIANSKPTAKKEGLEDLNEDSNDYRDEYQDQYDYDEEY
ncbi:hypothetical protein D5018_02680 [Parashewanella curva]|uniref:Uncharacterized protein n=1 Tax=Parashewanella curva TaxID=2338552 RepID=A0A3L8Q151_9GAMM|nr:hypothetical protein [Parashewanella curva]RLV61180.1 hypothetical protein D5018_02680 [Parashewanella curva]